MLVIAVQVCCMPAIAVQACCMLVIAEQNFLQACAGAHDACIIYTI